MAEVNAYQRNSMISPIQDINDSNFGLYEHENPSLVLPIIKELIDNIKDLIILFMKTGLEFNNYMRAIYFHPTLVIHQDRNTMDKYEISSIYMISLPSSVRIINAGIPAKRCYTIKNLDIQQVRGILQEILDNKMEVIN